MSYEKQTWANGDVITAEKLNHIEDGVYSNSQSGGVLLVNESYDDDTGISTLDKTYTEIKAAIDAGIPVTVLSQDTAATFVDFVSQCSTDDKVPPEHYDVYVFSATALANGDSPVLIYSSTTADGVLSYSE